MGSPVHDWFGLTRSSYCVLTRSLMQTMPIDWQRRFVELMREYGDAFETENIPDAFTVQIRNEHGRFVYNPFSNYRRPPTIPFKVPQCPVHECPMVADDPLEKPRPTSLHCAMDGCGHAASVIDSVSPMRWRRLRR